MATEQISMSEIKQAKEQGLIDQDELLEFVQNKRQQEIKNTRNKNSSLNLGSQLKSKNI